jgi:prepilin-type N-terminal cleavage/methylation domain-containing protein/prepilin-type processing-associated H-X9-DG protein
MQRRSSLTSLRGSSEHGFTLVELLVVLAVLSLLIALALPALAGARRRASATACQANLRGLGAAIHGFASDHDGLPVASLLTDARVDRSELLVALSPYLTINFEPGSGGTPTAAPFVCPADKQYGPVSGLSYAYAAALLMNAPNWLFDPYHVPQQSGAGKVAQRIYDANDGSKWKLMFDYDFFHAPKRHPQDRPEGGRNTLFYDGSVRPVS